MVPRHFAAFAVILALAATSHAAPDKDKINKAIKAGQDYLKAARRGDNGAIIGPAGINVGLAPVLGGGNGCGPACLTGLALVETGLDAKDGMVAEIARAVRANAFSSTNTYELSLMIMFFDRLNVAADRGLIQFLTLRLMTGQLAHGAWGYSCNGLNLDPVQARQLYAELLRNAKLTTPDPVRPKNKDSKPREDLDDLPKPPKKSEPPAKDSGPTDKEKDPKSGLHPALEKFGKGLRPGSGGDPGSDLAKQIPGGNLLTLGSDGDHSNTQFATVALWCGRRHGVDVDDFLMLIDKHYRSCQVSDGGWSYTKSGGVSSPAMACAGLMGLAMGFGAKNLDKKSGRAADPEAIADDRNVQAGLRYVGNFLAAAADQRGGGGFQANELTSNLYFMWSLERVGMVYGLTTIGKVDWYDWGAQVLLSTQLRDGSWGNQHAHHGSVENATAFALLFLSRSNLAEDVSSKLKGRVKDPGTSRLVGGGDLTKMIGEAGTGSTGTKRPDPKTPSPKTDNPPTVGPTDKAGKLAAALIAANATERAELLIQYRDTKGSEYTDALARAASKTESDAQVQIRDALAQRLTRMTTGTLNEMMSDPDRELRRSAALAVGAKGKDRLAEFATKLIRLIGDDETMVVQAARASLKALSGQDHGPETGASAADRGKALVAWRGWWENQKK